MRIKTGIIAGGGIMPALIAKGMRDKGLEPVMMLSSLENVNSTPKDIRVQVFALGELERLINYIKAEDIKEIVLAGKFSKIDFLQFKPDLAWQSILARIPNFQNDVICKALIESFEKDGIGVASQAKYLEDLVAIKGAIVGKPSKEELDDISFGYEIAKMIADADIGQTVVVKKKTVFAVEAIEGTNATILRGGQLAKEGAVAIKVSRTDQDWRVDVPAFGAETIKNAIAANIRVLAVEAGKAFFLEKEEAFKLAQDSGLAIYGHVK